MFSLSVIVQEVTETLNINTLLFESNSIYFIIRQTLRSHYKGIHNLDLPLSATKNLQAIESEGGAADMVGKSDGEKTKKLKGKGEFGETGTNALNLTHHPHSIANGGSQDTSWIHQGLQVRCLFVNP